MAMKRTTLGIVATLSMLLMIVPAYAEQPPLTVSSATSSRRIVALPREMRPMFEMLSDVAARLPSFGGMSYNSEEEVLDVYVQGLPDKTAVIGAIAEVFGSELIPQGGIRLVPGQYTYLQLRRWYEPVRGSVFPMQGVNGTSINEGKNRLRVTVDDELVVPRVKAKLEELSVPEEAVLIDVTGKLWLTSHTLQGQLTDGIPSGVKITNRQWTTQACTLGFITRRNGSLGSVTNSHCSRSMGSVDSDDFDQPFQPSGGWNTRLVGTETVDPPFFTSGQNSSCPPGERCRWSESVFLTATATLTLQQGQIARTLDYNCALDSLTNCITVDHNNARFKVSAEGASLFDGLLVSRVGQRSGWVQASITDTCADKKLMDTNHGEFTLLCQVEIATGTQGGDSGAPVFMINNSASGTVSLLGVAWGGSSTVSYFSKIGSIYLELGPSASWDSCSPEFSC